MKSILIPKPLHKKLHRVCIEKEITIKQATIEAIDSWIISASLRSKQSNKYK